jgi:type II secretory pathway pseudopilin PulG
MHRLIARLRRTQDGFGLVEALVAMTIVVGGVFAALTTFTDSLHGSATAQQVDVAVSTGTQVIEEMRAGAYADLATVPGTGAPALTADDPRQRLSSNGTKYQVPGGPNEDVVAATAKTTFKDYEEITVGQQTMRVYRFVSWRDEECPILDLTDLENTITSVSALLTTTTGLLNTLVGPGGTLTSSVNDGTAVQGNALLGLTLGPLITSLVNPILKPLQQALINPALLGPSQSLLGKLGTVLNPVTGHITQLLDLCDLPNGVLPDLGQLKLIKNALTTLTPILSTVSAVVGPLATALHSLLNLNVLNALTATLAATPAVLAAVTQLPAALTGITNLLAGVKDTLGNPMALASMLTSTVTGITQLVGFLLNPNTTHNTKRVSVAVWLKDRKVGYGPNKPIWLTSIVTDPTEGLL